MGAEIETRTAVYSVIEKGILRVVMKENVNVTLEDVVENYETTLQLAKGKRYAALVEGQEHVTIDDNASEFSSREETFKDVIALAIVIKSLSARLLGVFLMNLNKRKHNADIKLFSNKDDALLWIQKKVEEDRTKFA
ncbi:MAG TPA: hypothetical protein VNZ49_00885 [Bacteroidia bacterium]|nr:hypothetical protein [Bacteroidia bacterium]